MADNQEAAFANDIEAIRQATRPAPGGDPQAGDSQATQALWNELGEDGLFNRLPWC